MSVTSLSPRQLAARRARRAGEHRLDVPDARDVAHHDLLLGEERGGEDRAGRRSCCPAGTTVPESGTPPSMTNFSMRGAGRPEGRAPGGARVTAMSPLPSREEAWALLCEWTESDSLRRHMLAVEAAMRAYAAQLGEDEELWGETGLLHDLDYERYPDLETGHPRMAMAESSGAIPAGARPRDRLARRLPRRLARLAHGEDAVRGRRARGFVLAVAYVRPEGLTGMTPKSVKKKLKQPSFAAAIDRDELREGAEELGVVRRARRLRDRGAGRASYDVLPS